MGNSYSIDHFAKDHIHTDITCNIEEPQQKYSRGTVSNRDEFIHALLNQNLALCFRNGTIEPNQTKIHLLERHTKNV